MKAVAKEERRVAYSLALLFAILAAGIVAGGCFYYQNYERHFRDVAEQQLSSIAELKVDELAQFRKERLWDADAFFKNTAFSGLVRRFFDHPDDTDAQQQLQQWADKYLATRQYDHVRLFDAQGVSRLSVPAGRPPISSDVSQRIPEVLRSGQVTWHDFHRNENDHRIYLTLLVPILDETDSGRALGVLALRIDPEIYLYPFIKRWPTPSQTAETLLVRRDGNDALYLNDLKFGTNPALNLRISLVNTNVPAVKAILGEKGVVEGVDYRGEPVLAALRAIPDSPWFLVARVDTAEVYAPLRERLQLTILLVSLLLVSTGAGVNAIWRQQRVRFYKERHEMAETLRESEERFGRVFEEGPTGMAMLDETFRFIQVNPIFASMLGYSVAELRTKTFTDVTHPGHIKENVEQVRRLLRGELSVYRTEKRYIAKSGKVLWGQVQVSVLRNADGTFHYFLAIIGDITERKRAEEELRRVNRALRTVSDCNQAMVRAPDEVTLLTDICRLLVEHGGYRMAWVGFAEHDEARSVHPVAQSGFDEGYLDIVQVTWADTPRGRGPVGTAIRTKQPAVVRNVLTDPGFEPWRQAAIQRSYAAVTALPLMRDDHVYGALTVYAAEPDVFDAGEMELLTELAGDVAYGITSLRSSAERKRAEESLQNSQALYRSLVEHLPQSIFRKDRAGRFQFVNERFCRDLRRSFEDIVGKTDADFFPPELSQTYRRDDLRIMETGQGVEQEEKHVGADGQESFVHVIKTPLRDAHGQVIGIQGVFWDVTARKQAEESLLHEQTLMATLMENVPDAIYFKDAASRFLRANHAAARKLGLSDPAQLIGKSDADFYSREHARQSLADEQEILRTGRPLLNVEEKETWLDGTVSWGLTTKLPLRDATGRIIGTCGISRDITERKRADEVLRESRALYFSLVDQLTVGVFRKDRSGRYVLVNPEFCRLKGMKAEDFLGKTPGEVAEVVAAKQGATGLATKYAATGMEQHEQILQTGKSIELVEEYQKADGRKQFLRVVKSPVISLDGKIIGTQGIQFDITESRQAQETIAHERQLLRTLIDQLPETIYVKDLDSRFLVANESLTKQWGKASPAELLGRSDTDLFPADKAAEYRAEELKVFAGEPLIGRERIGVFSDGTQHTLLTTKVPFRDSQGNICGLVGIVHDITERKRAEEATARERHLLRALIDLLPETFYVKDLDGRFLVVNEALAKQWGKAGPAELLGLTDTDLFPAEAAARYHAEELKVFAGEPVVGRESICIFADGRQRTMLTTKLPFRDGQGKICGLVGLGYDITERKRVEAALRESEERYQQIARCTPDLIWTMDLSGRFTYANPAVERTHGWTVEEFQKLTFRETSTPEYAAKKAAMIAEELAKTASPQYDRGTTRTFESEELRKDGTTFWAEVSATFLWSDDGKPAGIIGVARDITERKLAEIELQESETRYQRISAAITDYIYNVRVADGRAVKTTHGPGCLAITGYQPKEFAHDPYLWFRMVAAEDRSSVEEQVRQILAGEDPLPIEHRIIRKDGTERWVRNTFVPHRDQHGALVAYDGLIQDITERWRAEAALRESEKKYRVLIETTATGLVIVDAQGRVLDANDEYVRLSGHEQQEQILGRSVTEWTAAHDRERNAREVKQCMASGSVRGLEIDYVHPDGTVVPIEINASTLGAGDDLKIMSLCRNITERKRTENELRLIKTGLNQIGVSILMALPDAKIVSVNDAACRNLGYTREELCQMSILDVDPTFDPKRWKTHRRELNLHGTRTFEGIHRRKDGTTFPVEVTVCFLKQEDRMHSISFARDITERRRMEEALVNSEEKLRNTFANAPVGIFQSTGDRLLFVNPTMAAMFGYESPAEMLASIADPDAFYVHPEQRRQMIREAMESGTYISRELEERRKDGSILITTTRMRVVRNETGEIKFVEGFVEDITERKRAEAEILRRTRELAAINSLTRGVSLSLSLKAVVAAALQELLNAVKTDLAFLFLREGELLVLGGIAPESGRERLGKIPEHRVGECMCGLAVRLGQPLYSRDIFSDLRCTWEECKKAGFRSFAALPLRVGDKIIGVVGLVSRTERDFESQSVFLETLASAISVSLHNARLFTETKQAEEALHQSETELHAILESTADGILAVDNKGKVIKANRRFIEFGRIPQSLINGGDDRAMLDFVRQQLPDPDAFLKRVHEIYGTDQVAMDTLAFKDGHVFERYSFPMMMDGMVIGRVWSFRDITERKRQEKELSEKNLELERFTYTVSHDLKSPLVTVKTFLGYLEQDLLTPDAERIKQDVGYMRTAADKMGHLLDELLNLARVGRKSNPPVRITFPQLAREAVGLVAGRISTSHAEVQVADTSVVLEGDRPRLVEIWQNLVENACKFMGDQPKPRVEIGVEQRGGETVFFVRDNGEGIDPRYHDKVFSLFEKLNPKVEGTGMGLALVKRVVELYKGRIWVESDGPGRGANFLFTLPAAVKLKSEQSS